MSALLASRDWRRAWTEAVWRGVCLSPWTSFKRLDRRRQVQKIGNAELARTFETSSGHKLVIEYGTVANAPEKVMGDDPIDAVILTRAADNRLRQRPSSIS